jgi:hypothetical protein
MSKEVKFKSRIIAPHSRNCIMKGKPSPWSGILIGSAHFGNYAANFSTNKGRFHIWYVISCNDPKCGAEKAIHSSVLVNA